MSHQAAHGLMAPWPRPPRAHSPATFASDHPSANIAGPRRKGPRNHLERFWVRGTQRPTLTHTWLMLDHDRNFINIWSSYVMGGGNFGN